MSIEGQGHSFTIYFPGFVCFVLYLDKISGELLGADLGADQLQCPCCGHMTSKRFCHDEPYLKQRSEASWGHPHCRVQCCCKINFQLHKECVGIMITCPCYVYPLTPHFYIVKLGFTGVYIFSYFCSKS